MCTKCYCGANPEFNNSPAPDSTISIFTSKIQMAEPERLFPYNQSKENAVFWN